MKTDRHDGRVAAALQRRRRLCCVHLLLAVCLNCTVAALGDDSTNAPTKPDRYFSYTNDVDPEVPWSIHVVKIDLSRAELRLGTTLGNGETLGMSTVTEQLKTLSPDLGQPLAAINGDFYEQGKDYAGRPRDVQIHEGEVVSHPAGHACFWIDPQGRPQMTNVHSRFRVIWPDGKATPIGLNAERADNAVMLYSAVIGATTATRGGIEYILEGTNAGLWLPLRAGQTYQARVREVRNSGNTTLDQKTLVLSIGPDLISSLPGLKPGVIFQLVTETVPDLAGVQTAIGGGPTLVEGGKVMEWKGWIHVRHPRSAVGWNEKSLFLVQVDGRQMDLSVGMTFSELASYMVKLGCNEALNFDGGGSATLWALGSVRNSPSEGQERPCPNTLVVFKKSPAPQPAK